MKKNKKANRSLNCFLLALLFFCLTNPTVKLVDLLPDFVACLIISRLLYRYIDRAPYFAEARDAFIKLSWLSFLRIPAFIIAALIKSKNTLDNDATVLLTFVFSVFEAYLLITAVKNLFSALFYVGMRSENKALLSSFSVSKKSAMRPESLRLFAYSFILFRAAATALPEMLLLTRSYEIGVNTKLFNFRALYPYFVVVLIPTVFVTGIILSRRFAKYIRSVSKDEALFKAADGLITEGARAELEAKLTAREAKRAIGFLCIVAILAVNLRISDFSMVDLVPDFLAAAFLLFGALKIAKSSKNFILYPLLFGGYALISAISYFVSVGYLDEFGYLNETAAARAEYTAVMNLAFVEFIALAAAMTALAFPLFAFIKRHTEREDCSPTPLKLEAQRKLKLRICGFCGFGILNGLMKFLNVVFAYYSKTTLVPTDDGFGAVASGLVPWFGTAVFISYLIFAAYTLYFTSLIKEDIDLKYS